MRLIYQALAIMAVCLPIASKAVVASATYQGKVNNPEKIRIISPEKKHFCVSSDDVRDAKEREKMRMERRGSMNTSSHLASGQKSVGERTYTVTCVFEGESFPYFAVYAPGFFEETSWRVWDEMESEDTYTFQIPAGTYDICANFYGELNGFRGYGIIVHEDVEINGDTTVSFSREEATVVQRVRPVLRNGEEAKLPMGTYLEEDPWLEIDDSEATVTFINYDYTIFRDGCEAIVSGYRMADFFEEGETSDFFKISNPLSDKYHTIVNTFLRVNDDEYEISTTDVVGISDRVVNTYDKDYAKLPVAKFVDTPVYTEEGVENYRMVVSGAYWIDNVLAGGGGLYVATTEPEVYVTSQPCSVADIKTVLSQKSVQMEKTVIFEIEEDGEIYTFTDQITGEMIALPVWYNEGKWNYINQNHSECGNFSYQRPVEGPIVEYPGLEPYCFTSEDITQPFGNSSPLLVIMTQIMDWEGSTLVYMSPQAWIGRYGEVRNCDNWTSAIKVLDGEGNVLFDNVDGGYIENWLLDYFTNPHTPGPLKAEFVDTNILIDGKIPGFNSTTMEIDETREDRCTPTPQMLMFKDSKGRINDRFAESKEGVIEFSAGDFLWNETEDNWYYSVEEADVKVEYAPYGEDAWQPIEVEQVPEYFYMPGFGYFYRGSLECVDMPSSNGWYDLRMTLTDKAGNRTVEHISPAFKVGAGSGVDGVTIDGLKVWASDGIIRTNATDVSSIVAYALDGSLLASGSTSALYVGGYTGALLVRLTTPAGTTTHKLLLH